MISSYGCLRAERTGTGAAITIGGIVARCVFDVNDAFPSRISGGQLGTCPRRILSLF